MTRLAIAAFICCLSSVVRAQTYDSVPPYRKDSTIPAFTILQTDSTWFNKEALPHDKPVIIIYFRPDCSHCQLTAHEFQQKLKKFKDAFFVWASYDSVAHIKSFAEEYRLLNAKNIKVGRDTKYYLPSFFRVKYTPFIAVYNKKGKLVQTYDGGTEPDTILQLLNF
jgi:thioredoxin-related protein